MSAHARRARILVVANRLPVRRVGKGRRAGWESSAGGLVTAMQPVLRQHGGAWIGWSGAAGPAPRAFIHEGVRVRPVALSRSEVERFYHGMSNETFWPLYHDAIRAPEFHRRWWDAYRRVNMRFARAAAAAARRGDLVWVHDYHLQLVPGMLRALRPDLRIGFFLHIPFPPEELFEWLPWRTQVLEGLLGASVVGFQTEAGGRNFSRLAREYTTAEGTDTELEFQGRRVRVGAFPISIDFDWFNAWARQPRVQADAAEIRRRVGEDRRILLAVDRLDYTKGLGLRLQAFEELLAERRLDAEECVLIQIAVPTREGVADYARMRRQIDEAVGRINGQFSEPGRVAVHYFRRNLTREELVAYYRAADVMLVTPLRDGMNLVAKEFVACRPDNSGVLVLSQFAGAARQMRRALLVNPYDIDQVKRTILQALRLRRSDARTRMTILRIMVRRHDVHHWASEFLEALRR